MRMRCCSSIVPVLFLYIFCICGQVRPISTSDARTTAQTTTTQRTEQQQTHPDRSTSASTTTTTTTPRPKPGVQLEGVAVGRTKIKITWKRYNTHYDTNLNDLAYIIQYSIKGLASWEEVIVPAKMPTLTIIDLIPNLKYRFRVAEKWRTNEERHTEFTSLIEVRTSPRTFRMFVQLPNVSADDLSIPGSVKYREMQGYVTDFVTDVFTSGYMRNYYQQIDFGSVDQVRFQTHVDRGTTATFLLFLTPKSTGQVQILKSAYEDTEKNIQNPREIKLFSITDLDECDSDEIRDCDRNAKCTNVEGSYRCNCEAGYTDASDIYYLLRGRRCEGVGITTTTTTKQTHPDRSTTVSATTTTSTTTTTWSKPGVQLKGVAVGRTKIKITWKRYNSYYDTNLNDLTYIIQYSIKGLSSWEEVTVLAKMPSLTIIDLIPNLKYRFRVAEKWRTNEEHRTEFTFPIEVRTSPRTFRMFVQLPNVSADDLSMPGSVKYREMQGYVTDFVTDIFKSGYMRNYYQQIDFGSVNQVRFQPHVDRGTTASFLLFLTPKSAGQVPLLKSAYKDTEKKIQNPWEIKLFSITDFDECDSDEIRDCDRNAKCTNVEGSYHCSCEAGYTDASDRYYLLRGRRCDGVGIATTTITSVQLKGVAVGRTKIKITWKRYNSHYDTNLNDLTYIIQYSIKGLSSWKEVTVPAKMTTLTIIDLVPELKYRFRVAEKWKTNEEHPTEFTFPIEVRTSPRTFKMFVQLPNVLADDLSMPGSVKYREMQIYVTDFVTGVFTSGYMHNYYQQIDFGSVDQVQFQPHVDRGTMATFLLFLTPKSAGQVPLLKSAYEDSEKKIQNPWEIKLFSITDFDECDSHEILNCDRNAKCTNVEGSYHCSCEAGYTDVSDRYYLLRGRRCEGVGITTTTTTSTLNFLKLLLPLVIIAPTLLLLRWYL